MRYLKSFTHLVSLAEASNEILDLNELEEFCEGYLVYLLEKDYKIEIIKDRIDFFYDDDYFDWEEIKDQFIPFIYMLGENYDISIVFSISVDVNIDLLRVTYDDLLKLELDYLITYINIYVKSKI